MDSKRIVIVGAGFAGVAATQQLRDVARAGHEVVLVNPENFFQYQPFLPEVASGTIDPRAAVVPLRRFLRHARIEIGEVSKVDLAARTVTVAHPGADDADARTLDYDILVLAAGSWSRVLPIPGLAERGVGFKTIQEATYLRNRVLSMLDRAAEMTDLGARRAALTFVIAGGGFAGVEVLGELESLARDAIREVPNLEPADMRWVLIEAGDEILPEMSPGLAGHARRQLEDRGIEVVTGVRLMSAADGIIGCSDGREYPAETLVWTAGVKPSPLAGTEGLPLNERGRIRVTDRLRVEGLEDVWAAGDIAAVPDRTTGGMAPPTAQHALREGRRLGKNLSASLLGGQEEPFVWRNVGEVCSLGQYQGVAVIYGIRLRGFIGWLLHRSYHLAAMPTVGHRVRIALDWTVALLFPRDTAQMGSFQDPREPFERAARDDKD